MIIGLGRAAVNNRRAILITLDEHDLEHLIAGGIEMNKEKHSGFPDDLEILIIVSSDARALAIASNAFPDAEFRQNEHSSNPKES